MNIDDRPHILEIFKWPYISSTRRPIHDMTRKLY